LPVQDLIDSLDEVRPLVDLIRVGTTDATKLTAATLDVALLAPAMGGAIVLLVSRFEKYLKDTGNAALDHFGRANPPVSRSALPSELQVKILSHNLVAATRKSEYGQDRPDVDRLRDIAAVSARVVSDEIWGDHARETHSNPNSDTVKSILTMLGIADPWSHLESEFGSVWASRMSVHAQLGAIPSARARLDSILSWRNTLAHSGTGVPISFQDVFETIEFFEGLGRAIDTVVSGHVNGQIVLLSSVPAAWP
jgi:hypothetical protein